MDWMNLLESMEVLHRHLKRSLIAFIGILSF